MWPARAGSLAVVVVAALVLTPVANAHLRTGAVAVDYRASVSPLGGALGRALTVRVFRTDLALALRVHSGHTVLVLGYLREPFLRLDAAGIAVNGNSPTAGAARLVKAPARSAGSSPAWRLRSRGDAIVWHDARLRGLPSGVDRRPWSVPLIVDGRLRRLEGDVWRVHAPPCGRGSRWVCPSSP